jgi:membrane protein
VAFYLQHPKLVRLAGKSYELSPRLREQEGLALMVVIAKRFYLQQPALTQDELEDVTGLQSDALQKLLTIFQENGLIVEVNANKSAFQPAQDIAQISVKSILVCLRTAEESDLMAIRSRADAVVTSLLNQLDKSHDAVLNDVSLRDLIVDDVVHA